MNRISIDGKQLKVVHYNGELWRADYTYIQKGVTARTNYRGAQYKYFTTSPNELNSYTRRGMSYIKKWQPRRPLVLIDILDKDTHTAVTQLIGEEYMKNPFPKNKKQGNKPYRVSTEATAKNDYAFLDRLCKLGLDGYYMEKQLARNGVNGFHSEIGLCSTAFNDLILMSDGKSNNGPALKRNRTRKSRLQFNSNNVNNNTIMRPMSMRLNTVMSPLKMSTTFNNSNNNAIMSPPKRRRLNNTKKNNTMR